MIATARSGAAASPAVDFLTVSPYVGRVSAPWEYARSPIPSVCRNPGAFCVFGPVS